MGDAYSLREPRAIPAGLGWLLVLGGYLVLEDDARRGPPLPWPAFAWLVRRVERDTSVLNAGGGASPPCGSGT